MTWISSCFTVRRQKVRILNPEDLAEKMNALIGEGYRVQAQKSFPERLRYRKLMEYTPGGLLK